VGCVGYMLDCWICWMKNELNEHKTREKQQLNSAKLKSRKDSQRDGPDVKSSRHHCGSSTAASRPGIQRNPNRVRAAFFF
jgi:hypothetical protein